jgi:glycosyltransferase involved in cell wall biosynthesis
MRVGVVMPRQPPTVGGGFTLHETVVQALASVNTNHEFVLLDTVGAGYGAGNGWPLVDVHSLFAYHRASAENRSVVEFAALKLSLDAVWYIDHVAEALSLPVFATVYDLAHRQHPFFPEVSDDDWGWGWEARENHYRRVLTRATRIFTGTPTGKNQIVASYGVNPANVIVNPFPVPKVASDADAQPDNEVLEKYELSSGYLFYPAQFWPHKNHVNLLRAFQKLKQAHGLEPDLVLTGQDKGNLQYVLQVAADLNVAKRLKHVGFVPAGDMPALYRRAAALVFPSFLGPDNLPPLEAFSFSCPVLASRVDGVTEQLGQKSAALFDPGNPADIADAMARVINNRRYRARLVRQGHKLAVDRTAEAYVAMVNATLDDFAPWRRTWPSGRLQALESISSFPEDLERAGLPHKGISGDGWVEKRSSLVLAAPKESSRLWIRGSVPGGDGFDGVVGLTVRINGQLAQEMGLGAGGFSISCPLPRLCGWNNIELDFNKQQQLADPDGRKVAAKLDFIGFWPTGSMRPPTAISEFPKDLANPDLLHSGIFDDGWLQETSSLILEAPSGPSILTIRGEIPVFGRRWSRTALCLSLGGGVTVRRTLRAGEFQIQLKSSATGRAHQIDLAFEAAHQLPEPDNRKVAARLDYIGFDQVTV